MSFTSLGLASASLGPTLPYLAEQTGSSLNQISILFSARPLGYLMGCGLGGGFYDRFRAHLLAALMLILIAATLALIPSMQLLSLLSVVIFALGIGEGVLDVGCNTLLVWSYKERVAQFMNALHFFFGLGAFISPLLVAWSILATQGVRSVYLGLAALCVPVAIWLLTLPSPRPPVPAPNAPAAKTDRPLIVMIALFAAIVASCEGSFGGWIYTYTTTVGLGSLTSAAYLTAAFWGAFTIGRLVSIPLAARVPPRNILFINLMGCMACLGTILIFRDSDIILWTATLGFGLFMASSFPTLLTFAGQHMQMSGRTTGIFFFGASIGGMTLPWTIGQLFEPIGPQIFIALLLITLTGGVFTLGLISRYTSRKSKVNTALPNRADGDDGELS